MPTLPYINEIHYSNAGPDENEFVEIAIDVSDTNTYQIQVYDGADGSLVTGTIATPSESTVGGIKYLVFATPALQNGLEGIALYDQTNAVREFLSYTGSFTAINGFASGLSRKPVLHL